MARNRSKEWIGRTDTAMPPPSVRLRIFRTHDGRCHITGAKIQPGDKWELDHLQAIEDGGEDRETNMAPALTWAHRAKTGQENSRRDAADRKAMRHLGIKQPKGRPLPGTKASGIRKRMNGDVERW